MLSHEKGKQSSFYYERDTSNKKVNLQAMGSDFRPSSKHSRKSSLDRSLEKARKKGNCACHSKGFKPTESNMSGLSQRNRSLEVSERLTGSLAFQMPNRHRHCKGMECSNTKIRHEQVSVLEKEPQQADLSSILRFRDENKADSKDFLPEPCVVKDKSG
jgi:hypothetical protein